jgi:Rad3-related DNA helicase
MTSEWQQWVQLPDWAEDYRPHQIEAVEALLEGYNSGKRVMMLDAPTGAGKSLIGEVMRQLARHYWNARHGLYVCTTKTLQDQLLHDFPVAHVIKGRANYPTFDEPDRFDNLGPRHLNAGMCSKRAFSSYDLPICDQCELADPDLSFQPEAGGIHEETNLLHCWNCHPYQYCPYETAKRDALAAPLAIANTAYFLTEANYVGRFGVQKDETFAFPFMVVDEADTLESVFMSHVQLAIPKRVIDELGVGVPQKKTKPEWWVEWATRTKQRVEGRCATLQHEMKTYVTTPPPHELRKDLQRWEGYLGQLELVIKDVSLAPDNWILDGTDEGRVVLKPVQVGSYGQSLLWRHSRRFLLMSATLISARQMADDLGLGPQEWGEVSVGSDFPVSRRPIYYRAAATISHKTKDTDFPKVAKAVSDILDAHRNERVLVHTVSYALTKAIEDHLRLTDHASRIITYGSSKERDSAIESYKRRADAVMLAPSLDRGIDLPDELVRAIVVAKLPFPNLGDEQIRQRFYGTYTGKGWYYMQTIRSLVQMTGRGMRHKDDYVTSYVLDGQFGNNLWPSPFGRSRIPKWWAEALIWPSPKRPT